MRHFFGFLLIFFSLNPLLAVDSVVDKEEKRKISSWKPQFTFNALKGRKPINHKTENPVITLFQAGMSDGIEEQFKPVVEMMRRDITKRYGTEPYVEIGLPPCQRTSLIFCFQNPDKQAVYLKYIKLPELQYTVEGNTKTHSYQFEDFFEEVEEASNQIKKDPANQLKDSFQEALGHLEKDPAKIGILVPWADESLELTFHDLNMDKRVLGENVCWGYVPSHETGKKIGQGMIEEDLNILEDSQQSIENILFNTSPHKKSKNQGNRGNRQWSSQKTSHNKFSNQRKK